MNEIHDALQVKIETILKRNQEKVKQAQVALANLRDLKNKLARETNMQKVHQMLMLMVNQL